MKRRTFVQTGIAGALGLTLQPAALPTLLHKEDIHSWLRQFSVSMKSRRILATRVLSDNDLQMTQSLDAYFAKRYFHRESNAVHIIANSDYSYFFYPVFQRHAVAGLCDVLVPVFMQQQGRSWQHIGTFTGFQVESLAHTINLLKNEDLDLNALLLPIASGITEGPVFSYKSSLGRVSFSSIIRGNAHTTLRIYSGDTLLLDDTYVSKHCLRSEAGA